MRFKDLIGRKSEPEVSPGRLVTTPAAPAAPNPPAHRTAPGAPIAPIAPATPAPRAPEPLADLFARLLATEQGEPLPPQSSLPIRLSEADVERIAARVAERVAGPLREDVRRVVGEVSERLVRAEIARIRGAAESEQP